METLCKNCKHILIDKDSPWSDEVTMKLAKCDATWTYDFITGEHSAEFCMMVNTDGKCPSFKSL
jgi:hypothetical protein